MTPPSSPMVPIVIFVLTAVFGMAAVIANLRFLAAFRREFPRIAAEKIPFAFEPVSHPGKATFPFSAEARELVRNHKELSRLRMQFVILTLLAIIVPLLGVGALFVAVVVLGRSG